MLWLGFVGVLALVPIVFLVRRRMRRARTVKYLSIKNACGIVEERYVRIGGIDQWIGIRGEDKDNPALLILHGGPGCSYSIFTPHLRVWEKQFTIVQWDQRGGGRTLAHMGKAGSGQVSFEQLTLDAVEVAEHVRKHLGKERILLLASSIGSTFGLRVVRRRPDLFYAYIGTDQNVGMRRHSDENHRELVERLCALGLTKDVDTLKRIGHDPARWSVDDFERVARSTMRSDPQSFKRTMKLLKDAVWFAPGWGLNDIRSFVAGMRFSLQQLLPEITQYDAWNEGTHFEIPLFIFQGKDDILTPPKLAQSFFEDVLAPAKHFALIPDAGHFAAFLQPEEFLRQLLLHARPLSDAPRPAAIVQSL
jgi:proline iminopeptidase